MANPAQSEADGDDGVSDAGTDDFEWGVTGGDVARDLGEEDKGDNPAMDAQDAVALAVVINAVSDGEVLAVDKRPGITAANLERLASKGDVIVSAIRQ